MTMAIVISSPPKRRADIPMIDERALAEAHPDYPVPRIMTREECEALITELLP